MLNILDSMNEGQRAAITASDGPVMVLAGPGSGKTRVLTHRIAFLIQEQQVLPYRILSVTFTNKAAREMKERAERLIGETARQVNLGTFHSICMRILRRETEHTDRNRDFVIYDSRDQNQLVKQILQDLNLDSNKFQPNSVLNAISSAKNELIRPDRMAVNNYDAEIVQRVYTEYEKRLKVSNARDFDDLLTHTVWMFRKHPMVLDKYHSYFTHILVDEFQDTNMVQYELVRQLAGETRNLFVVGDPDQSIYAFRGADYRNVRRFQTDFEPAVVVLDQNYRSHQYILDAAMAVIRKNPDHIKRDLFSERKEGAKLVIHEAYNEREEAQYVMDVIQNTIVSGEYNLSDFAVLYRINAQSRVLEEQFIRAGVPYLLVGATRFYGRKEIKDVLAFLRVVHNPLDSVSLDRIINVPPRGIGPKTVTQFMAWADSLSGGVWEAMQILERGDASPLSGRSRTKLTDFAKMIVDLRKDAEDSTPLEMLDAVLDATGYMAFLQRDTTDKGSDRQDNIAELRRVAHEYATLPLGEFLIEVALVSEVDNLSEAPDAPTLLTFHAAKGLEFPIVFMVGMEEGILPHNRSVDDADQLAEERRLMYVGLTRARDQIHLLYTFRRMMWGYQDMNTPSRFLADIPPEITSGYAKVPQPAKGHIYYSDKWDTDWSPERERKKAERPRSTKSVFGKGQRVTHGTFGDGIVISSDGSSGIEIVEVLFKGVGKKKLDASYLKVVE